jgi:hypothetical protein
MHLNPSAIHPKGLSGGNKRRPFQPSDRRTVGANLSVHSLGFRQNMAKGMVTVIRQGRFFQI